MEKLTDFTLPPKEFSYSPWRHGGWYTNVRYPSGASGCVSNNYDDRKWRIACDPRPFEQQPTFHSRHDAAMAEWHLVQSLRNKPVLEALRAFRDEFGEAMEADSALLGSDAVDAIRRLWPQVKAALALAA